MSTDSAAFAQRLHAKPVATAAQIKNAMPTDEFGRTSVRVGKKLVPLMPVGTNLPPAGVKMAAAPSGLVSTGKPATVDHTLDQTPVKNQGDRPTCVSFALLAALEALFLRKGGKEINLSEQYAHWLCMSSQGKTQCDSGPYTVQAAACLHHAGVCEESLSPYQDIAEVTANCADTPSAKARHKAIYGLGSYSSLFKHGLSGWSIGNTDQLETLLAQDLDIVVGFEGIFGLTDPDSGILDIFLDGQGNPWPAQAAHTMLAVGYYRDPLNPYFLFKNSWLDPTGDGYMKVSYDYLRQYATCGVVPHQIRTDMPVNGSANNGGPG
jgi:papain like protease